MHDDTNLRRVKRPTTHPESDNRNVIDLGLEVLSQNLRRDWSFVSFMTNAHNMSTLECVRCKKQSTTFQVDTSLPLALPERTELNVFVVVHGLPRKIKAMIDQPVPISSARDSDDSESLQQPLQVFVKVNRTATVAELAKKIVAIQEVNFAASGAEALKEKTEMVLYSLNQEGAILGIFDPEQPLNNYPIIREKDSEVHAQEVLLRPGRQHIREKLHKSHSLRTDPTTPMLFLHKLNVRLGGGNTVADGDEMAAHKRMVEAKKRKATELSRIYLFNRYWAACDVYDDIVKRGEMPDDIYVVAYHRRFTKPPFKIFQELQPQLIASPIVLVLPHELTGIQLYEEVWAHAQSILKAECEFLEREKIWWLDEHWADLLEQQREADEQTAAGKPQSPTGLKPFILKTVDRSGHYCSVCHWTKKCSGHVIEPSNKPVESFFKKSHLVLEWHSLMIERDYQPESKVVVKH